MMLYKIDRLSMARILCNILKRSRQFSTKPPPVCPQPVRSSLCSSQPVKSLSFRHLKSVAATSSLTLSVNSFPSGYSPSWVSGISNQPVFDGEACSRLEEDQTPPALENGAFERLVKIPPYQPVLENSIYNRLGNTSGLEKTKPVLGKCTYTRLSNVPSERVIQCRHKATYSGKGGVLSSARHNATYVGSGGAAAPRATATSFPQAENLDHISEDIRIALCEQGRAPLLEEVGCYYFDGEGKSIRPHITLLMASAINRHLNMQRSSPLHSQLEVAKVAEMIHTASLQHDDVLDEADTRRGKASVTQKYLQRKSVFGGVYILSEASILLSRIDCPAVTIVLAQVLEDLILGEFMQLSTKQNAKERFEHYLEKSFKKTAALIAYSCQAVALLSHASPELQRIAFEYGKNVGIAFQLVDDFLDFVGTEQEVGKPTSVDLKLGMATAPVLFAAEEFPELNALIARRFDQPGDVQRAAHCVHRSQGLRKTRELAVKHCEAAINNIRSLQDSREKTALIDVTDVLINRTR